MLLNLPGFVRSLLRLPSRGDEVGSLEVHMFSLNRKEDQLPRAMGRRSFLIGCWCSGRRACLRRTFRGASQHMRLQRPQIFRRRSRS